MAIDDLISRIRDTPISAAIEAYGYPVTKKGSTHVCLCPFHDDHAPSMSVNDSKGMFYCFVCNIGGDAIKFVRLLKRLEFIEALKDICDRMSWSFQDYEETKQKNPKVDMAKKILLKSSQLYFKIGGTGTHPAYPDFIKKRNLNDDIANTYQLGYAPPDSQLTKYLNSIPNEKERNFALQVATEIGVIRPDKHRENSHYDTFRDRIMFPIWDQYGKTIGFTSRAVKDDAKAKYLNSIDSYVFNKRDLLYGIHLAKTVIRDKDQVILVEGNMDQVTLFSNGFQNSVAIMGTALGDSSLSRLIPMTKNYYLCLDNDQAGHKAAERINAQIMEHGLTPRYVDLSPHKDPDDFIQIEGTLEFQKRLDEAIPFVDHLINENFPEEIPTITDRQLSVLQSFYPYLEPWKDSLAAKERIAQLAKRLGMQSDPANIIADYESFLEKNSKKNPSYNANKVQKAPVEAVPHAEFEQPPMPEYEFGDVSLGKLEENFTRIEKTLVQELVQHPELLLNDEVSELLDFIGHSEVKRFILGLKDLMYEIDESEYEKVVTAHLGRADLSLELTTTASAALFKYRQTALDEKVLKKMFGDIKRRLREDELRIKRELVKQKQLQTQNPEEFNQLLKELSKLDKELNQIKSAPRRYK